MLAFPDPFLDARHGQVTGVRDFPDGKRFVVRHGILPSVEKSLGRYSHFTGKLGLVKRLMEFHLN